MGQSEQKQLPFPGNPGHLSSNKCHACPRPAKQEAALPATQQPGQEDAPLMPCLWP